MSLERKPYPSDLDDETYIFMVQYLVLAIIDSRTLQSTPESGGRAGYDGGKRRKGNKIHAAVDTMGNFITLMVSATHEQDREQVYKLCKEIRQITGEKVDVVIADQGYTGENANIDAAVNDVELVVVKRPTSTSLGSGTVICLDSAFSSSCTESRAS